MHVKKYQGSNQLSSFHTMFTVLLWLVLSLLHSCDGLEEKSVQEEQANRKAIRKDLLQDHDEVIGPLKFIKEGKDAVDVIFSFTLYHLYEVDTKDQTLKLHGWILQKWQDQSLSWNATNYGGVSYSVFSRNEIWVPDIALKNNAKEGEKLAGGRDKFITDVNALSTGNLSWLSPATFTSTCEQNVLSWPKDKQVCYLYFGSFTYNLNLFKITPNANYTYYEKGSVSNGQWIVEDVEVTSETANHNGCCGSFSVILYKLYLKRKPQYFVFYLVTPIIFLLMLAMLSFLIPTESGERISFITTILLAQIVFLEMIPEFLPRSSDQLPILGIFMIISLGIISIVLMATIFILLCHYHEGVPPYLIRKLFYPFNSKKGQADINVHVNEAVQLENISPTEGAKKRHSSRNIPDDEVKENRYTWKDIANKLNWVSFGLIFVGTMSIVLHLVL